MRFPRPLLFLISLILILASAACVVLTLITGATNKSVFAKFYWLETDCSGYPGSPIDGKCRWTSYGMCGVKNGANTGCTKNKADYPFSPKDNFDSTESVPDAFISGRKKYFYMSRIGWALEVVALFFILVSLVPFIKYLSSGRQGRWKVLFWTVHYMGFLFTTVAMALLTATYVDAKQTFNNNNNEADLGTRSMATAWVGVACFLLNQFVIVYLLFCKFRDNLPAGGHPIPGAPKELEDRIDQISQQVSQNGGSNLMDRLSHESYRSSSPFAGSVNQGGSTANEQASVVPSSVAPSFSNQIAQEQQEYEAQVQAVMRKMQQEHEARLSAYGGSPQVGSAPAVEVSAAAEEPVDSTGNVNIKVQ